MRIYLNVQVVCELTKNAALIAASEIHILELWFQSNNPLDGRCYRNTVHIDFENLIKDKMKSKEK
jgi:hypothetical protein